MKAVNSAAENAEFGTSRVEKRERPLENSSINLVSDFILGYEKVAYFSDFTDSWRIASYKAATKSIILSEKNCKKTKEYAAFSAERYLKVQL